MGAAANRPRRDPDQPVFITIRTMRLPRLYGLAEGWEEPHLVMTLDGGETMPAPMVYHGRRALRLPAARRPAIR